MSYKTIFFKDKHQKARIYLFYSCFYLNLVFLLEILQIEQVEFWSYAADGWSVEFSFFGFCCFLKHILSSLIMAHNLLLCNSLQVAWL